VWQCGQKLVDFTQPLGRVERRQMGGHHHDTMGLRNDRTVVHAAQQLLHSGERTRGCQTGGIARSLQHEHVFMPPPCSIPTERPLGVSVQLLKRDDVRLQPGQQGDDIRPSLGRVDEPVSNVVGDHAEPSVGLRRLRRAACQAIQQQKNEEDAFRRACRFRASSSAPQESHIDIRCCFDLATSSRFPNSTTEASSDAPSRPFSTSVASPPPFASRNSRSARQHRPAGLSISRPFHLGLTVRRRGRRQSCSNPLPRRLP